MAEAVKVIVRCRPLNQRERNLKCENIVEMDEKIGQCRLRKPGEKNQPAKPFTFDGVFNIDSITESIYADICFPLVEGIVEGYNGTVFAYGQTGCGKSFTMQGIEEPPSQRGIIPRGFEHVFEAIHITENAKFLVNASYLEIYNEDIRDLLVKDKGKLEVKEHPDRGVYVKELSMTTCHNVKDMEKLMAKGGENRHVGATLMNADSSRSHSIFTIYVETSEQGADGEDHIRAGKLHLVDLAGSERQAKTGATGDRLKEATKINLSLSALGNVISALVDGRSKHIPYRDSKLTRLLQDSLGGNTKTLMVACVSPADNNYEETLSTLRYANRAKNIKNKPKINEDPKDALLRQFQDEITLLKQLLTGQLEMSPQLIAQLGIAGTTAAPAVPSIPLAAPPPAATTHVSTHQDVEKETGKLKEEYEEKLATLQTKYEEEHKDKKRLAEEVSNLQEDLNRKLKVASSKADTVGAAKTDGLAAVEDLSESSGDLLVDGSDVVETAIVETAHVVETSIVESAHVVDSAVVRAEDTEDDTLPIGEHVSTEGVDSMVGSPGVTMVTPVVDAVAVGNLSNIDMKIQEEAAKRLNTLQEHLVKSEEEAPNKAELKKKHNIRKSHYNKRQQKMMKEIQKWEGEGIMVKVYDNLQDEIKDKQSEITKLEGTVQVANLEINDLQSEFQTERDDYLDTIRKLERQLLLQNQIIDKVQPTIRRDCNYYNIERMKGLSEFDEESQSWKVPDLQIERTTLPKPSLETKDNPALKKVVAQDVGDARDDAVDRYAIHIQNRSCEEFSNNYFKNKRADKLLAGSNSSVGMNSLLSDNNNTLFNKMPPPSKSPVTEFTRRPLKLEALPPSAFDKKKKKSKNKDF